MKNFKRTLALVLAVIMVAGMFASVSAAKAKWYADAVRYVEGVGIATIGSTAEDKITRDEFVLWIAKLESGVLNDAYWSAAIETPFTDITEDNNQTAIWYSARRGLIVGNGDGTFAPDKNITFAEAAAVIVRLMRYTSKVEGEADAWQWAYMDVANEYCKAFTNTFLANVGGSVYDYDYELTKGEAAYIIATIMNSEVIEDGDQIDDSNPYKTTYKSLTIDGMNLGERFKKLEGTFGVSGNTYMISEIAFDEEDGTVAGTVVLTAVSAKANVSEIELSASDFTKFVRVSLGLADTKAEEEAEIRVVDSVKIGNLVDVVLNKNNTVASLKVHSGSKVVDTHVVMDSMLGIEYPNGNGIANWTADSIVSGASNSNEYRDAIINGTWSSDLLFTWDGTKLVFGGTKYAFSQKQIAGADTEDDTTDDKYVVNGDLTVYEEKNNVLVQITNTKDDETTTAEDERYVLTTAGLKALIPDVATGEVTLIFNDQDLDGKYDTLVITADHRSDFELIYVENETINDKYYAEGWSIDSKTASGKLQLLVLAQGRFGHYSIEDKNGNTSVKDEYTAGNYEGDYGRNYMNPYQVIDLATISSGVIEESTLKTFNGNEVYYVVTVKNAAGAREKLYIPFSTATETAPKFSYSINGVSKTYTPEDWDVDKALEFVNEIPDLIGVKTDADKESYADNAAKLVGQYISYVVLNNKVVYCVQGAAAEGEAGYLLDVEATDVANMYNVTIATIVTGERNNGKVSDVKIYSVNATASAMMNSNYDAIASIFNKGNVHADADLWNRYGKNIWAIAADIKADGMIDLSTSTYVDAYGDNLYAVSVHSNGTFSYIVVDDNANNLIFTDYNNGTKLSSNAVRLDKVGDSNDKLLDANGNAIVAGNGFVVADDGKIYYEIAANNGLAGHASDAIKVYREYESEYYYDPTYFYDEETDKWYLCVATETITLTYNFGVDSTAVTKDNYTTISDTALADILEAAGIDGWVNIVINANGTSIVAYENYVAGTADSTYNKAGKVVDLTDNTIVIADYEEGSTTKTGGYRIPAQVKKDADGNLYVAYDFRGVDRTVAIKVAKTTAKITVGGNKVTGTNDMGYYSFANATVTEATVVTDTAKKTSGNVVRNAGTKVRTIVDADSSISNVTFTAMDKTEPGYIPGSYWFSLNDANTLYFNGDKAATDVLPETVDKYAPVTKDEYDAIKAAGFAVTTSSIKFRATSNTEVILLTPTATGYVVKVMTPAEAAAKDLIISHYSFVVPAQLNEAMNKSTVAYNKYNNYNNKLDAIVLVGQEALVATTPEVEDGKTVSANEYLVYVPADTETILVAPEGSKTVKVASTKSVYAVPSGTEIGSIYYEYDVYTGAEAAKIKTVIGSGWYIVTESGKIVEELGNIADYKVSSKSNGKYVNNAYVSVNGDKVTATVYVVADNKETSTVLATYDLSKVTFLYKDVDGTLKVTADKDAKFASDSIFTIEMKTAKAAVESAYADTLKTWSSSSKKAEKVAAYEAAVAAYNELLAANIDKFFNGDILDSFKAVVDTETSIQGDGEYTIDIYTVDEEVFVILNDWTLVDLATGEGVTASTKDYIAVVESNLK